MLVIQYRQRNMPRLAAQSALFNGPDLERVDPAHPLSGLRIARNIRAAGLVDFRCVARLSSHYEITQVHLERIGEDLKKRRMKWSPGQFNQFQMTIQEAFAMAEVPS